MNAELFPDELKQKILNYTNVITFRNGKYINKISPLDERYKLLQCVPKKIIFKNRKILLNLLNSKSSGYIIEYTRENSKLNLKFVVKNVVLSETNFIHKNTKWVKLVNYSM